MRHLDFSETSDVVTYDYGAGLLGIGISPKADHKLAGTSITEIFDPGELEEILKFLASSGLKVPHH